MDRFSKELASALQEDTSLEEIARATTRRNALIRGLPFVPPPTQDDSSSTETDVTALQKSSDSEDYSTPRPSTSKSNIRRERKVNRAAMKCEKGSEVHNNAETDGPSCSTVLKAAARALRKRGPQMDESNSSNSDGKRRCFSRLQNNEHSQGKVNAISTPHDTHMVEYGRRSSSSVAKSPGDDLLPMDCDESNDELSFSDPDDQRPSNNRYDCDADDELTEAEVAEFDFMRKRTKKSSPQDLTGFDAE